MNDDAIRNRLSQLSTCWTLLAQAHGDAASLLGQAQAALIERYQEAVYRYLCAMLRDADAADEVFQEFALRMVRGDFHKADASKGRFRNYVKTSLIHLVREYRAKKARQAMSELENPEEVAGSTPEDDTAFLDNWRKTLLDRAWESLERQETPGGPPYFRLLRLRTENPDWTSGKLAEEMNARMKPDSISEVALRKVLQRAREVFTEALLDEVARSLGNAHQDDLEQEVADLGFQVYCSKAMQKRKGQRPA